MALARVRLLISGRVQGVFFRDSTRQQALQHNVTGWVRNLPDGRVEAVLEGEEEAVAAVARWCRHGPPGAFVERVEERRETPTGQFSTFTIERTPG